MGYVFCTSSCANCGRLFSYNPMRVPSVRVKGAREPVCETCIRRANQLRIANGLDPFVVLPDAYQPCDESEL